MKRLRFLMEAALLWVMLGLFRLVGIDAASAIGGAIGAEWCQKVTRELRKLGANAAHEVAPLVG